jgi:23S rRNA (guanosine2251-2'-O)-methyltransferase
MPSIEKSKKTSMDELDRMSVTQFKQTQKAPICVVVDNLRSLQNIGSIFRTSDAFRIEKIYLCGISGVPPNKEIEKTALGSTHSVNFQYFESVIELIKHLKNEGWKIISIEQTSDSKYLQDFEPIQTEKYALVFGNEVFGVSQEFLDASDTVIEIPQFGTKHSFNVSTSAGIVLWDFYSKNNLYRF